MSSEMLNDGNSYWLWPACVAQSPNQYVQFRHEFTLPVVKGDAQIHICCDSNYRSMMSW